MRLILALTLVAALACTKKEVSAPETKAVSNQLEISVVGEQMAFNKTILEAPAETEVTLVFKNPSSTLKHNWVLVRPGKENDVGLASIEAGESKDYIPVNQEKENVLAHTKLVGPKSEETIKFTTPKVGSYPYICTFPGHFAVMRGTLKIR